MTKKMKKNQKMKKLKIKNSLMTLFQAQINFNKIQTKTNKRKNLKNDDDDDDDNVMINK